MIDVPHKPSESSEDAAGQGLAWWSVVAYRGDQSRIPLGFVLLRCPHGHTATLRNLQSGDGHSIDENGVVTPSVVCPRDGCSFHEMVRLLDWPPPERPASEL